MNKIYIVKKQTNWDDFICEIDIKAFYNKSDAEEYIKLCEKENIIKPDFYTDELNEAFIETENSYKFPLIRLPFGTPEYYEEFEKQCDLERDYIIEELNVKGFEMNEERYKIYIDYIESFDECTPEYCIKELEIE